MLNKRIGVLAALACSVLAIHQKLNTPQIDPADTFLDAKTLPQGSILLDDPNAHTGGLYCIDLPEHSQRKITSKEEAYGLVNSDGKGLLWRQENGKIRLFDIATRQITFLTVKSNLGLNVNSVSYLNNAWIIQTEDAWIFKSPITEQKIKLGTSSREYVPVMFLDAHHLLTIQTVHSSDSQAANVFDQLVVFDNATGHSDMLMRFSDRSSWTIDANRKRMYALHLDGTLERWQWTGNKFFNTEHNKLPRTHSDAGCERIVVIPGTDWLLCQQNQHKWLLGFIQAYADESKFYAYNYSTHERKLVFDPQAKPENLYGWAFK